MRMTLALVLAAGLLFAACNSDDGSAKAGNPFGASSKTATSNAKPPLQLAPGATVTIGNEGSATKVADGQPIECNDNAVTVVGVTQVLTFTGECRSISVGSGANSLTIDRVKTLKLSGSVGDIIQIKAVDTITMDADTISNTITAKGTLAGTGKPQCNDSGTGNQCP